MLPLFLTCVAEQFHFRLAVWVSRRRRVVYFSALCDTLLLRHPRMKILALAPERNVSIFFWASFDIHSSQVEASQAGILSTLRRKIQYVGG